MALFTSPLRGEVGAKRRVRGSAQAETTYLVTTAEPLTLTLSPQGRGDQIELLDR
ncbi:hypothetical protein SAMN05428969_2463 [Devosia sp. YR412]|nr:hypothetical protein SAMN05428969_2463 [Devosia sp. YR412]